MKTEPYVGLAIAAAAVCAAALAALLVKGRGTAV